MTDRARKYGITNAVLASYLGYASTNAFEASKAKEKWTKAVDLLIRDIESTIRQGLIEGLDKGFQ